MHLTIKKRFEIRSYYNRAENMLEYHVKEGRKYHGMFSSLEEANKYCRSLLTNK